MFLTHMIDFEQNEPQIPQLKDSNSKETLVWIIMYNLVLKIIIDEYFAARHLIESFNRNDGYIEHLNHIEELNNEINELQSELKSIKFKMSEVLEINGNLNGENLTLLEDNKRLLSSISNSEENKKELIALRDFLFSYNNDTVEPNELNDNDKIEFLKFQSIIVLGGSISWVKKLKASLPSINHINIEKQINDISFLSKPDQFIFFNTATNSHSFYNKFITEMRKNKNPLYFLNQNGSINRTIEEMYNFVQSNLNARQ